jgi:hypothetical protein
METDMLMKMRMLDPIKRSLLPIAVTIWVLMAATPLLLSTLIGSGIHHHHRQEDQRDDRYHLLPDLVVIEAR